MPPASERPHELVGHDNGWFVVDGKVKEVKGEAACYELARDPDFPEIHVFWNREGAEAELAWRKEHGVKSG